MKKLISLIIFGIAFGFVEAAVVVYLRRIFGLMPYQTGDFNILLNLKAIAFASPLTNIFQDVQINMVETIREFSTLIMLLSVSYLAGKSFKNKLGALMVTFSIWDLCYYMFLHAILGWPAGFFDLDVFFLIPVPWVGPVITPIVISSILLILGVKLYRDDT